MKKIIKILSALSFVMLFGCAEKESYDKSKAVSAFFNKDNLEISSALENVGIVLPKPVLTFSSLKGENDEMVENIFFQRAEGSSKFLNKYNRVWSGYKGGFNDRFVFSPIIYDQKIFVLDASGKLFAYQLSTKKQIWKNRIFPRKFLQNYQNLKIGYSDKKIFAISGMNEVEAINADNGNIIWKKNISSLPISTPVADKNFVYVTTADNKTYALDANSGKIGWVSAGIGKSTAIFGAATPVLYKDKLLVAYSSGEIYALKKLNGEVLWSQSLNINKATNSDFYLNDIDATPIVKNNIVYSIGNGGLIMAINIENGDYLWKKEIAAISDFWLAGEFLYLINNDGKLIAIERNKGLIKWVSQLPNLTDEKNAATKIIYNGVVMASNKLLITSSDGKVIVASPFNGSIEQTLDVGHNIYHAPIIVDGKIYLHAVGSFIIKLIEIS